MIQAQYVTVNGSTGFVETSGTGRPLVCIHTAGQSGVQWRNVLFELPAHGYEVIVPDLPGHGRSDHAFGGPITDLGSYAEWLGGLLNELGVRSPWVVGCSIGGKIALEMAADRSIAPKGVVAMAADAFNDPTATRGYVRALEDSASPSRADRTYYGTLASVGGSVSAERAAHIAAMHRREDPIVSTSDLIAWSTHDLRPRLSSIQCPVRLVIGEDDFWINMADISTTVAALPNCTYERLEGIGHYPMDELEDFPSMLATWLEEMGAEQDTSSERLPDPVNSSPRSSGYRRDDR